MKIIITDDEEIMRDCICDYLRQRGYSCKAASSADEALTMVNRYGADIVIADINMPNMNGIELLKIIREQHPEIKVIMLTGFASTKNALEAVNLGAYGFFRKSLDLLKFSKMITSIEQEMKEKEFSGN